MSLTLTDLSTYYQMLENDSGGDKDVILPEIASPKTSPQVDAGFPISITNESTSTGNILVKKSDLTLVATLTPGSTSIFVAKLVAGAVWEEFVFSTGAGIVNHASSHTNGSDDIQDATAGQKGLMTQAYATKVDGIESGATGDQTDGEIKTAYENNADTNAFTDAEQTKLTGLGSSSDLSIQFGSAGVGSWLIDTTSTANNPSAGDLRFNNASQAGTTELYLNLTTDDAQNFGHYEDLVGFDSRIYLFNRSDLTQYKAYVITGTTSEVAGVLTMPVTLQQSNGADFGDDDDVFIAVYLNSNRSTANTSRFGVIKTATNADVNTGTATDKAITPDALTNSTPTFDGSNLTNVVSTRTEVSAEKALAGTINKGQIVHLVGEDAGVATVDLAQSDSSSTMPALGMANGTITDTVAGKVVLSGILLNIDTSSWLSGTNLYVDPAVAGGLTSTKPTGTNLIQKFGQVIDSDPAGSIFIFGAGRSNDLPNLPNNEIWVGNGSGVPTGTDITTAINTAGATMNTDTDLSSTSWLKDDGTLSGADATKTVSERAIKEYADAIAAGVSPKQAAHVATTTYLDAVTGNTWTKSGTGVGKTLTDGAVGIMTVDGHALLLGDRVVVKDEDGSSVNLTDADQGIYDVTTEGTAGVATILTRSLDFDGNPAGEVESGSFTFIQQGTVNAQTGWMVISSISITVDTDPIPFTQFQGLPGTHAATHTDGTDDIQDATAGQKGLATAAQITKLDGIESNATADQSDAEIKTAYENNANTNAFTDANVTTLSGAEQTSSKGANNGYAGLDGSGLIDKNDLPSTVNGLLVSGNFATSNGYVSLGSGVNISSASALPWLGDGFHHIVTGSATINTIDTHFSDSLLLLSFTGTPTLVHSATLELPTASNIVVASGDIALFRQVNGTNWECLSYQRADGTALVADHGDLTGLADDDHTQYPLIQNAGATANPDGVTTPDRVGAVIVDTTNDEVYQAVGTTNTDWAKLSNQRTIIIPADHFDVTDNADWSVNAQGAVTVDDTNNAIKIVRFDDTTEEGVGFVIDIPDNVTNIHFTTISAAQTGAATNVVPRIATRDLALGAVIPVWDTQNFDAITMNASGYRVSDTYTNTLTALSLVAGNQAQFQLTRRTASVNDTLTGDWNLYTLKITFS